jgi:hypothetical protein
LKSRLRSEKERLVTALATVKSRIDSGLLVEDREIFSETPENKLSYLALVEVTLTKAEQKQLEVTLTKAKQKPS